MAPRLEMPVVFVVDSPRGCLAGVYPYIVALSHARAAVDLGRTHGIFTLQGARQIEVLFELGALPDMENGKRLPVEFSMAIFEAMRAYDEVRA